MKQTPPQTKARIEKFPPYEPLSSPPDAWHGPHHVKTSHNQHFHKSQADAGAGEDTGGCSGGKEIRRIEENHRSTTMKLKDLFKNFSLKSIRLSPAGAELGKTWEIPEWNNFIIREPSCHKASQ